ncbi:MAG: autotransporter assembly complex family protein [Bilophila sp.]
MSANTRNKQTGRCSRHPQSLLRALFAGTGIALCLASGCGKHLSEAPPPSALERQASDATAPPATQSKKIPYKVRFLAPGVEAILPELKENSQLAWLETDPPDSRVGLERRMLEDRETARKLLRSHGYYDGTVRERVDWNAQPVLVELELDAGRRYVIGTSAIRYLPPYPSDQEKAHTTPFMGQDFMRTAPTSLTAFGLPSGAPAKAQSVLNAVDKLMLALHEQGYPLAVADKTRYIVDRSTGKLEAAISVATGPLLRMGTVRVQEERGESAVSAHYLNQLATWTRGQFWDERLLKTYRTALQETGLFSSIALKPGTGTPSSKTTPVDLTVRDAPPRTISGGVQYSTDTGPGLRGAWENRNLFGNGEHLRLTMPLAKDLQMLSATFRKPAFGLREQTLVGEAEARNETSDAYEQTAAYVAGGLERRFRGDWRNWWVSARLSLEAGTQNDNLLGRRAYSLFGVPLAVRRDTTNDLFNPTSGTRLNLTVTPYTGVYDGALATVRTRLDASAYVTPFNTSRLVLAVRCGVGSLSEGNIENMPASLRFYSGGGGSVRGYKYQSLGPHDRNGDPVGGLSFTDVGVEARIKITEQFGIVPFLDGGMVYEDALPKWGKDMAFGAGLGFRYYTVIGPIRLDVATPLQDRDNNKAFQIYLSIGQAF